MASSSSISTSSLPAALILTLILITSTPLVSGGVTRPPPTFSYHGGPLLTGNLDLSLLFYGAVGRVQKHVIRGFLQSLNGGGLVQPQVSSWWHMVESYQSISSPNPPPKIQVKVVSQITENNYSVGKVITIDYIKMMVNKVTAGKPPNTLAVIFTGREVSVSSHCRGKCYDHGVIDNHPYLIVGNPETECPGACAWPFIKSDYGPPGITVKPPNGKVGADAILVNFAAGLAAVVTNPFDTGFSKPGPKTWPLEASTVCEGIFATGSFPGNPGKVAVDRESGGAFNAHGLNGMKFLLPAVWNPRTSSCWTPM